MDICSDAQHFEGLVLLRNVTEIERQLDEMSRRYFSVFGIITVMIFSPKYSLRQGLIF